MMEGKEIWKENKMNCDVKPQSINALLKPFQKLKCTAAWRSIGTNIFLEFGEIKLKQNRGGVHVPRADISIGIHADHWKLLSNGKIILNADIVDDQLLARCFNEYLKGVTIPIFQCNEEGAKILKFSKNFILISKGFDDPDYWADEPEITVEIVGREVLEVK